MHHSKLKLLSVLTLTSTLIACGGGSGGGNGDGRLNLSVTDAPVDEATAVMVTFTSVEIHGSGDRDVLVEFDEPMQIDLLALQGDDSTPLLSGQTLTPGEYQWIRLGVSTNEEMDTYLQLGDAIHELDVPSGAQNGLKLNRGFTVTAGGVTNFTIDFDLRKSIHQNNSGYVLRPTLRIVDDNEIGHLQGSVDNSLLSNQCGQKDNYAVYAFTGADATLDDLGSSNAPLTTALLTESEGVYSYEIGYLLAGTYTVALVCDSTSDQPDSDDEVVFHLGGNVTISEGDTAIFNFE